MDIKTRLDELFHIRLQLKQLISEQLQDMDKDDPAPIIEEAPNHQSNHLSYRAVDLAAWVPKKRAKELSVSSSQEELSIRSELEETKYAYLTLTKRWNLNDVLSDSTLSVKMDTAKKTLLARPVITFFDETHKKLTHQFFETDIPMQLNPPDGCDHVEVGIRIQGSGEVALSCFSFQVPTLQQVCDLNFIDRIADKIAQIPVSNGMRYYDRYPGKVGIIADRFLYDSFSDAAELVYITPENYLKLAEETDFLILASAWHGLRNEWDGMSNPNSNNGVLIYDVIAHYHEIGKHVVFYSKEDPGHYEVFLPLARQCDYIFTSALECCELYVRDCNTDQVDVLPFGFNPVFNNPVGIRSATLEPGVLFAGSWMAKYEERTEKLCTLFDGVLKAGLPLKIIDRNYFDNNPRYFFPERYYPYISPAIDHDTLQKVHKLFRWAININSATKSHTMFANRVYELQANGNLLLSNYSLGVAEQFPEVFILENTDDVAAVLRSMDDEEEYLHQIESVRRVMTGESTFDRFIKISDAIGVDHSIKTRRVAVIVDSITDELRAAFDAQTYPNKVLVPVETLTNNNLDDVDLLAFWCDRFSYGAFYLEDMINGFKYTDCDCITKSAWKDRGDSIRPGTEHDYVSRCESKYVTVFWKRSWDLETLVSMDGGSFDASAYSIDHFNLQEQ